MSDWGGPQLLVGGTRDERIARLVLCSCEAFDNVPPKGAARLLPYLARIPGGLAAALLPFRFDRLRRLPMTYGPLSKRPVPREVMDRWFGPIVRSARSAATCASTCSAPHKAAATCSPPPTRCGVRPPRARRMGKRRPADATRTRPPARRDAPPRPPRGDRRLLHADPRGPASHAHRTHARIARPATIHGLTEVIIRRVSERSAGANAR